MTDPSPVGAVDGDWHGGTLPGNTRIDPSAYVETSHSFSRCRSRATPAVTMARGSTAYSGTMFDLGEWGSVRIGRYALLHGARIICDGRIEIGDHALVSWNVVIMDTYRLSADPGRRRRQLQARLRGVDGDQEPEPSRPVTLASNVWVGFDSCILPGVTVGEGSIIGARSVVGSDVPPYWLAAGNPARLVRPVGDP